MSKKEDVAVAENATAIKINPFSLSRPVPRTITRSFRDPLQPGIELVLTLKSLDQAELVKALEVSEFFSERYVGSMDHPPSMVFPPVAGAEVAVSRTLIQTAVVLVAMQVEQLYTVEDFVAFSVTMPNAWKDLTIAVNEVQVSEPKKG